jgi:hypothetical protein
MPKPTREKSLRVINGGDEACQHLPSGSHTVQWYLEQNLAHLNAQIKGLAGMYNQASV